MSILTIKDSSEVREDWFEELFNREGKMYINLYDVDKNKIVYILDMFGGYEMSHTFSLMNITSGILFINKDNLEDFKESVIGLVDRFSSKHHVLYLEIE